MKRKIKITYLIEDTIDIDSFLGNQSISSSNIEHLYQSKGIYVNGQLVLTNQLLLASDLLEIALYEEKQTFKAIQHPIEIIYEDDYLLIVNKPANLNVMSNRRYYENNLSSYVLNYLQKQDTFFAVHLVNRLDRITQGLVLIAKHGILHHMLEKTKIIKKYQLRIEGHLENKKGTIAVPILKSDEGQKRMVAPHGKMAITEYEVIQENSDSSDIIATLMTGKTHQLRVTFASLGHPIIGDSLYGSTSVQDLCLCSYYLEFIHPITKQKMIFEIQPSF